MIKAVNDSNNMKSNMITRPARLNYGSNSNLFVLAEKNSNSDRHINHIITLHSLVKNVSATDY